MRTRAREMLLARQPNRLAQRLGQFFTLHTATELGVAPPRRPSPLIEKDQLARQLLATLSPLVLAETGHLERRGADRDGAEPESLRAARLRASAARARRGVPGTTSASVRR